MSAGIEDYDTASDYVWIDATDRMFMSNTDEEIENKMDDEDPLRKGWPKLRKLPLRSDRSAREEQSIILGEGHDGEHRWAMQKILHKQRSPRNGDHFQVCHRLRPNETPNNASLTLVVGLDDKSPPDPLVLSQAVKDLRKYLKSVHIDITIEAFLPHCSHDLGTYPIRGDEDQAIIDLWSHSKLHVLEVLRTSKLPWSSLEVLKIGTYADHDEPIPQKRWPAVVICSEMPEDPGWNSVVHEIRVALGDSIQDLQVTLRWGLCHNSSQASASAKDIGIDYQDRFWSAGADFGLGSSIGLEGCTPTTTLGGGLILEKDGIEVGQFAITTGRGLDGSLATGHKSVVGDHDPLRPTHSAVLERSFKMRSPSDSDTAVQLAYMETFKKELSDNLSISTMPGLDKSEAHEEFMRVLTRRIEEKDAKYELLRSKDRSLGYVYAASSRRTTTSGLASGRWPLD